MILVEALDNRVSQEESASVVSSLKNAELKILESFVHSMEKNDQNSLSRLIHECFQSHID